jgi:hypothetical protein
MQDLPHLPALRRGKPYESLEQAKVCDHRAARPLALISQVNAGVVRKDLARIAESCAALQKFTVAQLLEICAVASDRFLTADLPLGDRGHTQSPHQYIETLSGTSGLPHVLIRRNMTKIGQALSNMGTVLKGLTRGLDLSILDRGFGEQNGIRISYYPTTQALGLVMPSNSPAVNSLWLPAIPLKIPVILKPGRDEPWTPYRLIQAFIAAGCPAEAFGFYPTDHEGAGEILKSCGRALIFGDKSTTAQYANNPAIQIHGPGFSKILIGEDQVERWPEFIDVLVAAISDNGGRSCINASAVLTPRYAHEIGEALATRLGSLQPLAPDAPNAALSAFANPKMADYIDHAIEEGLATPGAMDLTAAHRGGPRKVEFNGGIYLRPTIVLCDSMSHPLANREFLFPYASVVEVPQTQMLRQIGPSLAVTAITKDPAWCAQLIGCSLIDRLNFGPISTMNVAWDQPHEGNMFEFLYKRRSLERAPQW